MQLQGRVQSVDILRGFAMLWVIIINLLEMNGLPALENNLYKAHPHWYVYLFVDSIWMVFSLLFGVSLYLSRQSVKSETDQQVFARLISLFIISIPLTFAVWWGTILLFYAIFGILTLLLIRHIQLRTRLLLAITLFVLHPIVRNLLELNIPFLQAKIYFNWLSPYTSELQQGFTHGFWSIARTNIAAFFESWLGIVHGGVTISDIIDNIFDNGPVMIFALILFGYSIAEQKILSKSSRHYLYFLLGSIITYSIIALLDYLYPELYLHILVDLLTAFIVSLTIMLLCQTRFAILLSPFELVGKTSLSFYVLSMLAGYFLFYIFTYYQTFSYDQIDRISSAVFIVLWIINYFMVKYVKYGPCEIIQRKMTIWIKGLLWHTQPGIKQRNHTEKT